MLATMRAAASSDGARRRERSPRTAREPAAAAGDCGDARPGPVSAGSQRRTPASSRRPRSGLRGTGRTCRRPATRSARTTRWTCSSAHLAPPPAAVPPPASAMLPTLPAGLLDPWTAGRGPVGWLRDPSSRPTRPARALGAPPPEGSCALREASRADQRASSSACTAHSTGAAVLHPAGPSPRGLRRARLRPPRLPGLARASGVSAERPPTSTTSSTWSRWSAPGGR